MADENDETPDEGADSSKDSITLPKVKFEERLERASRSKLTALFGTSDETKIKERLATAERLEKEATDRANADKTEIERMRDEAAKSKAAMEEAREEAELAKQRSHITRLGAERGITNIDLLEHKVFKALDELPEGDGELDEVEYIEGLLKDPRERIALGVDDVPAAAAPGAAPPPARPPGATTSPPAPARRQPPPPPNAAPPAVDVSSMTPEQYRKWKAQHGIR